MKKSDLENGMVVEWRNGTKLIKVNDIFLNFDGFSNLDSFGENLKFNLHNNSSLDIVKIYKVNRFTTDLKSIFEDNNLTLIWERGIDWTKVPFGTKVIVSDCLDNLNETDGFEYMFISYEPKLKEFPFIVALNHNEKVTSYKHCMIYSSVKIQEEWYKEC